MKHWNIYKRGRKNEPLEDEKDGQGSRLILHNDNFHTFDYVIGALIEVCGHNSVQAEQCALLTHYKGRCEIKYGKTEQLSPVKDKLANKGLQVTIES